MTDAVSVIRKSEKDRVREWRRNNPEAAKQSVKNWRSKNPERIAVYTNRSVLRRAIKNLERGGLVQKSTFEKFPELKEHPNGKLLWAYYASAVIE